MFTKPENVRPFQPRRVAPPRGLTRRGHGIAVARNLTGADTHPKAVLVCRWIEVGGRLECRWEVATGGEAQLDTSELPRLIGRAFEPPLCRACAA